MFPKSPIRESGLLDVGSGQTIYWEESGRSDGIPALYLHGGPGGTLGAGGYVTKFDPERYRTIGMDQRGCGRSKPLAIESDHDLGRNTTQALINDAERLRESLGIDRMSPDDQIRLVGEICDLLDAEAASLTDAQTDSLDRRIARLDADPTSAIAWEVVEAEALKRLRK